MTKEKEKSSFAKWPDRKNEKYKSSFAKWSKRLESKNSVANGQKIK